MIFIEALLTVADAAHPLNKTECVEWHNKYREKHQVNTESYIYILVCASAVELNLPEGALLTGV
jgi:hypothetical protein